MVLWTLTLPDEHCHHIGMGKPLGLGSVQIDSILMLIDRKKRYRSLFDNDCWDQAQTPSGDIEQYKREFEDYVCQQLTSQGTAVATFKDIPRIKSLLTLLKYPGPSRSTGYMNLQTFGDRRVLPPPEQVSG